MGKEEVNKLMSEMLEGMERASKEGDRKAVFQEFKKKVEESKKGKKG